MKITNSNFSINICKNYQPFADSHKKQIIQTPSFSHKKEKDTFEKNIDRTNSSQTNTLKNTKNNLSVSHTDFLKKFQTAYPKKELLKIISNTVQNADCYINEGSKNATYKFPKLDEYIIRIPKKFKNNFLKQNFDNILPIEDEYPSLNVGQPILENAQKIQICKKQTGRPIASCDWGKLQADKKILDHNLAQAFLEDIENLASFPVGSYREVIRTLKQIDKHRIDFLNANNFLIDTKNKKINRVDITDTPTPPKSGYSLDMTKEDVIFALINALIHSYVRDELDDDEKCRLDKATIEVIKKCNIATDIENIDYRYDYPSDYWKKTILDFIGEDLYKKFEEDINRTKNIYIENIYNNSDEI